MKESEKMPLSLKIGIVFYFIIGWAIMWGLLELVNRNPVPWP